LNFARPWIVRSVFEQVFVVKPSGLDHPTSPSRVN
jgi:hypothetical protein